MRCASKRKKKDKQRLKPNGILSFSDHHMNENEIESNVTSRRLFGLLRKGKRTYSFLKGE